MSLKIVFMGTPGFSVPTLEALIKNKFNVFKVYTQPPKKSKRGQKINPTPVENFCKENNIDFNNPENLNNNEELNNFKKISPDVVVVVAYGQIIPKTFLPIPKFGFLNLTLSIPDVDIFIDGKLLSSALIKNSEIQSGVHTLVARKNLYHDYSLDFEISSGVLVEFLFFKLVATEQTMKIFDMTCHIHPIFWIKTS